jgi:protein Tex
MELTLQSFLQKQISGVSFKSAQAVIELSAEGATVPFIARYRKEKTGNLDEVQIRAVIEMHENYNEILKRKTFLVKEIGEQGNLTAELEKRIQTSWDLAELEEIYRPYKKKKKTKATIAREAGLEPLANWIWDLGHGLIKDDTTMEVKAKGFLNIEKSIVSYDAALKAAQDIIIEKLANEPELRKVVQQNYNEKGKILSKRAKGYKPNSKYEMYQEFQEPVKSLLDSKSSHRYLAMRRGWEEEELVVEVKGDDDLLTIQYEKYATTTPDTAVGEFLKQSAKMALTVYVLPSVHNEIHRLLKDKADDDATRVFSENVRKVLLGSPYGSKVVLGVDPGLRTGCKIALVDKSGNFITHTVMQLVGEGVEEKAKTLFAETLKNVKIEAIAVGNGTAGRQAEIFIRKIIKDLGKEKEVPVIMVSESGASVYSASEVAREEFPKLDITVKGAISIARRLQDPLSELVKVDPKSIGVGQYQHDINQTKLKKSLEAVVESCVNQVGVDVNTASEQLLSFVSGVGPALAKSIVETRKNGLFQERSELTKVPKLSIKVFEQAAGFFRISSGKVFLDSTGIHPERYSAVREMAQEIGVPVTELVGGGAQKLLQLRTKWAQVIGEFTFDDILRELEKPGRDPRDPFKVFQFRDDIFEVKDLKEGMICPGLVTNVTNFGAFVDIGVHQDGLVHISELSHTFVQDPRKVVNPGDQVTVRVLTVDLTKNQIALSMKLEAAPQGVAREYREPREHREPREQRGPRQQPRAQGDRPQGGGRDNRDAGRRPQGDRPQSSQHSSQASSQPRRPEGKNSHMGSGGAGQGPRPQGKPFNNPFAALLKK